jgi:hypothetical protein
VFAVQLGYLKIPNQKNFKRGCFHNSCYSNEFEKRMDVRRDVTTQQADDERNDENR